MGVLISGIPVFQLHLYCMAQIFDEGDIDEIYKFLVIHRSVVLVMPFTFSFSFS